MRKSCTRTGCRGPMVLKGPVDSAGQLRWKCRACGVTAKSWGMVTILRNLRPSTYDKEIS